LPANQNFQYRAGQYIEFILRDGARRSYSMANAPHDAGQPAGDRTAPAPHARRQVHRPRLRRDEGEGHPAHGRPVRQLLPARGQRAKPIILLASGTGFAPIKALIEQLQHLGSTRPAVLYWGCRRRPTCTARLVPAGSRRLPNLRYVPVLSEPHRRRLAGRTGLVHQA
jgi:CDP-4-dehydro-6-deoxyglucose reductase